ncbi:hypothetical protein CWM24_07450 [Escherichia coli]|nr:hypothetical protein CWM24_07450 [Escherichia coli]
MKKTAPDGAVSGMPAIWETRVEKNLQAITVSTILSAHVSWIHRIQQKKTGKVSPPCPFSLKPKRLLRVVIT